MSSTFTFRSAFLSPFSTLLFWLSPRFRPALFSQGFGAPFFLSVVAQCFCSSVFAQSRFSMSFSFTVLVHRSCSSIPLSIFTHRFPLSPYLLRHFSFSGSAWWFRSPFSLAFFVHRFFVAVFARGFSLSILAKQVFALSLFAHRFCSSSFSFSVLVHRFLPSFSLSFPPPRSFRSPYSLIGFPLIGFPGRFRSPFLLRVALLSTFAEESVFAQHFRSAFPLVPKFSSVSFTNFLLNIFAPVAFAQRCRSASFARRFALDVR